MILGLDISTSITGFCVLDISGEVIRADAWDTRNKNKFNSIFDKAQYVKEKLCELKAQFPIEKVYIEKPFMFFNSGGSSAKTMATLQKFNGIISWVCFSIFDKKPEYLTAQEARKLCGVKVTRDRNAKKRIIKWLLDNESSFKVEYTTHGNPKPKYYDIADAIIVAKAGAARLNEQHNS